MIGYRMQRFCEIKNQRYLIRGKMLQTQKMLVGPVGWDLRQDQGS